MTREKWAYLAPKIFLAGGIAWFIKLLVIAGDGPDPIISFSFVVGIALLLIGSTAVGARLTLTSPGWVFVGALILSPIVFWFGFTALDPVGRALVGDAGPSWFKDEIGILLTAVLATLAALWLLVRAKRPPTPAS